MQSAWKSSRTVILAISLIANATLAAGNDNSSSSRYRVFKLKRCKGVRLSDGISNRDLACGAPLT